MTLGERLLAAIDEALVGQVKGAADAAWARLSGGHTSLDEAATEYLTALDNLVALHERVRANTAEKFK